MEASLWGGKNKFQSTVNKQYSSTFDWAFVHNVFKFTINELIILYFYKNFNFQILCQNLKTK